MDMVKAALSHSSAFHRYVNACSEDRLDIYTGISDSSDAYLKRRVAYSKGEELPEGWTPASTYFCIESGRILGVIRVRHTTSPYIHDVIGHIGYETLPQTRGGVSQVICCLGFNGTYCPKALVLRVRGAI